MGNSGPDKHMAKLLLEHVGHTIECVTYGLPGESPDNVSVECIDCSVVLVDYDLDEQEV
jgi:hypothetical protein